MNKLEMIEQLCMRADIDISKAEAKDIVNRFSGMMAESLADGDRVERRELCSFCVKDYKS